MKQFLIFWFLLVMCAPVFAQEEDENCTSPNKKAMKQLNAAINSPDLRTAVEKFNTAIDLDGEKALIYYEYAMYAYNNAMQLYERATNPAAGNRAMARAEKLFLQTIETCPNYHANCYYHLGVISYTRKDYPNAVKWFKKFENFHHNDNTRYPEDHGKKLADVREVLKEIERDAEVKDKSVPFDPKIVRSVSTKADEYFPMISPDNDLMFYTRKKDTRNLGDISSNIRELFSVSQRIDKHAFEIGKRIEAPFNDGSFQSYGAATLSVDNKEMIICACNPIEVYGQNYVNCDLYSTTYIRSGKGGNDYEWTPLKNLGENINGEARWDAQPSLSADGNTLYYTVNGPNTRNNDIFVSERQPDGTWGKSRPFDEINTDGKDKSPFLHQDSETLYFVSECTKDRIGVGGLDIFYTRMENGKWTKPKNIGYPINTEADELGLFVSIDGELAYYSSRQGGSWNIYSFELYEEARPQSVTIIKGDLTSEEGTPIENATIEILYEGEEAPTKVKVNGNDGKYAAIVKTDTKGDVMVTVKKEGGAFESKIIAKEEIKKDTPIKGKDLAVAKLKVGGTYTINDILYSTSSATLTKRIRFILKGFANYLKDNPTIKVAIHGHTDDVGDDSKNLQLSDNRAKGVKDYLVSLGISSNRLSSKGFGETKPKFPNTSSVNRAKNRRTEFVIEGM